MKKRFNFLLFYDTKRLLQKKGDFINIMLNKNLVF